MQEIIAYIESKGLNYRVSEDEIWGLYQLEIWRKEKGIIRCYPYHMDDFLIKSAIEDIDSEFD